MTPYGRQEITEADQAAVRAVLQSDWLTQGPAVPAFEAAVARRVGADGVHLSAACRWPARVSKCKSTGRLRR